MNILSLFDGHSTGRLVLDELEIEVEKYYSSEVDKYAMQISKKHFSDIVQLGDITKWKSWDIDFSKIDLLLAGFPCQAWSVAGKQNGDNDPRGALVHDLIAIWNEIRKYNPDVKFLFENVKMKKEFLDYVNNLFGVEPILINSALVSAQNRKRYYWTNIEGVEQPEDKWILLKDVVHENCDFKNHILSHSAVARIDRKAYSKPKLEPDKTGTINTKNNSGQLSMDSGTTLIFENLQEYIVPFDKTLQILNKEVERGKVGYFRKDSQANRVYYIHDKAVTLCGEAGGGAAKMGQYLFGDVRCCTTQRSEEGRRKRRESIKNNGVDYTSFSDTEHITRADDKTGTLTTVLKDNYLFGCITPDRINKRQNGQRFNEGKKFYTLTAQDKHGVLIEGYIRKLTPVECERLQTLPDGYTEGVSNSQRYKMIGNGWTKDVIKHILKGLKDVSKI